VVVYAKRPFAGPEAVLAYLSRYTHRVAISNSRLVALDERGVTFRWKDYRAHGRTRQKLMTLSAEEFMRRFLLHVLPVAFTASATMGCSLMPVARQHRHRLAHCCSNLRHPFMSIRIERPTFLCRHCGAPMLIIETFARAQQIRGPPAWSASP